MLDTVNAGWPTFWLDPRDNRNFDPQGDHLHFNLNTWQYNSTKVEGIVVTSALREHRYTIAVLLPRGHPEGDKAFRGDNRRLICDGTELNVSPTSRLGRDIADLALGCLQLAWLTRPIGPHSVGRLQVPGLQVLERDGVPQLDPIADEPYEEIQEWDLSIPWRSLPFWFFDATEAEKRWREGQAGGAGKTD
jgi:hypothetical protein